MRRRRTVLVILLTSTLAATTGAAPALAKKDPPALNNEYRQWNTAAGFNEGTFNGATLNGDAIEIATPTGTFDYNDPHGDGSSVTYEVASWTSPEIAPGGFNYTELIASWNARTPPGTWIEVSVSGRADDGTQSKDYILGRWAEDTSTIHPTSVPSQGDGLNYVAIDTLKSYSDRFMQTWQLTVSLFREQGSSATPSVSLVGAVASDLPEKVKDLEASPLGGAEGIELAVPPYSQEIHIGEYPEYDGGGEAWCSPTSTAMILGYWQQQGGEQWGPTPDDYAWVDPSYDDPWVDHAARQVFDYNYDGAGNWPFNAAYAATFGHEAFITRLRDLNEAEQFIKAGIPLVVSLSFKKNELTGAGYGTNGHLLTIVGFTEDGDVIANDPASHLIQSNDEVRVVYDRTEFENVWVPHSGGVAYVIRPPHVDLPTAPDQPNW